MLALSIYVGITCQPIMLFIVLAYLMEAYNIELLQFFDARNETTGAYRVILIASFVNFYYCSKF